MFQLLSLETSVKYRLREYFLDKAKTVRMYNSLPKKDHRVTPSKLSQIECDPCVEAISTTEIKERWESKALHGRYPTTIEAKLIDQAATHAWLNAGDLHAETEGFLAAVQDQYIATKYYRKTILKDDLCNVNCSFFANCNALFFKFFILIKRLNFYSVNRIFCA